MGASHLFAKGRLKLGLKEPVVRLVGIRCEGVGEWEGGVVVGVCVRCYEEVSSGDSGRQGCFFRALCQMARLVPYLRHCSRRPP